MIFATSKLRTPPRSSPLFSSVFVLFGGTLTSNLLSLIRISYLFRSQEEKALEHISSEIKQISTNPSQRFLMVFFKTRPSLALSGFTSRQLRVIKAVTKKHFKDLTYIRVAGEVTSPQQLIVYTNSNDDRDLLMVRHKGIDHKQNSC